MDNPRASNRVIQPQLFIFLFSLCNGIGNPMLIVRDSVEDLQLLNYQIVLHSTFIYEVDEQANDYCKTILQATAFPGNIYFAGDLAKFADHAAALTIQLHSGSDDFLVIVTAGTPCKSISFGSRLNVSRTQFGLHAPPSNVWWLAYSGIKILYTKYPNRLLTFVENVRPPEVDLRELDRTAGHRNTMNVPSGAGIPRNRFVWTNYPFPNFPPDFLSQQRTRDQYGRPILPFPLQYQSRSSGLPCLRAIFPKLFWQQAEEDPALSAQDKNTVQSCYIWNAITEKVTLPPLAVWCDMLGFPVHLLQAIQSKFPCSGQIRTWPASGLLEGACGDWAYCPACSSFLQALGESWHVDVTRHYFTTFLLHYFEHHRYNTESKPFAFIVPEHKCGPKCIFSRRHL